MSIGGWECPLCGISFHTKVHRDWRERNVDVADYFGDIIGFRPLRRRKP
jgi:hypothetical protein